MKKPKKPFNSLKDSVLMKMFKKLLMEKPTELEMERPEEKDINLRRDLSLSMLMKTLNSSRPSETSLELKPLTFTDLTLNNSPPEDKWVDSLSGLLPLSTLWTAFSDLSEKPELKRKDTTFKDPS